MAGPRISVSFSMISASLPPGGATWKIIRHAFISTDKNLLFGSGQAKKDRLCTVTKLFTTYGVFRFPLTIQIKIVTLKHV